MGYDKGVGLITISMLIILINRYIKRAGIVVVHKSEKCSRYVFFQL